MLIAKRVPHRFNLDGFQHPIEYVYYTCDAQGSTALVTVFYPAATLLEEYQSAMPEIASWIIGNRGLDPAKSRFALCERPVDGKGRPQAARLPIKVVDIEWNEDTAVGVRFRGGTEEDYFGLAKIYQCEAPWGKAGITLEGVTLDDMHQVMHRVSQEGDYQAVRTAWRISRQWDRCTYSYWVDWIAVFCVRLEYLRQERVRIEVEWLSDSTAFPAVLVQGLKEAWDATPLLQPLASEHAGGLIRAIVGDALEDTDGAGSSDFVRLAYEPYSLDLQFRGQVSDFLAVISELGRQEAPTLGFDPFWPISPSGSKSGLGTQGGGLPRRIEMYGPRKKTDPREGNDWAELTLSSTGTGTTILHLRVDKSNWITIEPIWEMLMGELEERKWIPRREATQPWERVPDIGSQREMLKLWHLGYKTPEIASSLMFSKKTVSNKISSLRQQYGEVVVPVRRRRA